MMKKRLMAVSGNPALLSRFCLLLCLGIGTQVARGQQMIAVTLTVNQPAELQAHAGDDISFFEESVVLGSTPAATGGTPPYTYLWSPSDKLSSHTVANPTLSSLVGVDETYVLTVTDQSGCTAQDNTRVKVLITGQGDVHQNGIRVYPNPSDDLLFVETDTEIVDLFFYDLNGQTLITGKNVGKDFKITLAHLPRGVYSLVIKTTTTTAYRKIMVGHD